MQTENETGTENIRVNRTFYFFFYSIQRPVYYAAWITIIIIVYIHGKWRFTSVPLLHIWMGSRHWCANMAHRFFHPSMVYVHYAAMSTQFFRMYASHEEFLRKRNHSRVFLNPIKRRLSWSWQRKNTIMLKTINSFIFSQLLQMLPSKLKSLKKSTWNDKTQRIHKNEFSQNATDCSDAMF